MASGPGYNPNHAYYSPLGGEAAIHESPMSTSEPWNAAGGDLGYGGIEMNNAPRPNPPNHQNSRNSEYSLAPSLFSGPTQTGESESFLHDPLTKIDTTYNAHHVPYKDHTGKQFQHILIGMSARWFMTAGLCAAYILAVVYWHNRGPQTEMQKRIQNSITTAVSIALGLNVASAFKDVALNMRWVILSRRKRPLIELDLLLHADSMMSLAELVFTARRAAVVIGCVIWLLVNIAAQVGIAVISLTYGWTQDCSGVIMSHGNVSISDVSGFFSQEKVAHNTIQDESYTAHLYGALGVNYGVNFTKYKPEGGDLYDPDAASIWYDNTTSSLEYLFIDSPAGSVSAGVYSVYTNRAINATWKCDAHEVTKNGDGSSKNITVADIGDINVSHVAPNSTTYFTNTSTPNSNLCGPRCSIIEAFEPSADKGWYYKCNLTFSKTANDPLNVSYVSDSMALIAGASIVETGYKDGSGQDAQIYPQGSVSGSPSNGDPEKKGLKLGTYAIGAIAGAALFNPATSYIGMSPSSGQCLEIGHPVAFYTIIGLICGCHLGLGIATAVLSNRVKVGPDKHLNMSLLLRPIADALHGFGSGSKNNALKEAKRKTYARYEKTPNGRWQFSMT